MSPIIDIQRRLVEVARIRPGAQVKTGTTRKDGKPATRPVKLDAWRFTSRSSRVLEAVAGLCGGEVRRWDDAPTDDQFELFSTSAEIDVVLPPERISFSQWMESWSAGGCQHRCDGQFDEITNSPCSCDPEKPLCTPHTRLSVMLAGIPTTGLFRVETQGHYAKAELAGAMELAELLTATTGRSVLPAKLRLEHRKVVRDGKTRQFVVPVLDFQVDVAAIAAGSAPVAIGPAPAAMPAQPTGLTPIPASDEKAPSLAEQLAAVDDPPPAKRRSNSPPSIPPTGLAPRPAAEVDADPETGEIVAQAEPPAEKAPPRRRRTTRTAAPAETHPATRPFTKDDEVARVTEKRRTELVILVSEFFPERPARLQAASNVLGRPVESFKDLTPFEGNQIARWVHEMKEAR